MGYNGGGYPLAVMKGALRSFARPFVEYRVEPQTASLKKWGCSRQGLVQYLETKSVPSEVNLELAVLETFEITANIMVKLVPTRRCSRFDTADKCKNNHIWSE